MNIRTLEFSLIAAALTGALLFSGCGAPPAGGGDDAGGPPPQGPLSLSGKAEAVFRDLSGVETREPIDLHTTFVSAAFPEAGGFRTVEGAGGADGTLAIPAAGEGAHWLRLYDGPNDWDGYVWTDAPEFDLDVHVAGRPDAEHATLDTTVALFDRLDGLAPAQSDDGFELVSGNLGFSKPLMLFPAAGATTLTGSLPWNGMPLIDAAKNDDVTIVQYQHHVDPATTWGYYSVARSAQLPGIEMKDGEIDILQGSFTTPPDLTYTLAWKRSAFAALRPQIHPSAGDPAGSWAELVAQPGGADFGELGLLLPKVFALDSGTLSGFDDLDTTFEIHNPFPESWLVNDFHMEFPVDVAVPGDPSATHITAWAAIGVKTTHLPDSDHPIVPQISPIRELRIDGKDAFTDQTGVGTTPVVSWSAPQIGTPTGYEMDVYEWQGIADGVGSLVFRAALMIPGDQTSVQFPPTVLHEGQVYMMTIRAIHQDGQDVRAHGLFTQGLDYAWADAVTGSFAP